MKYECANILTSSLRLSFEIRTSTAETYYYIIAIL
jgi:hypothetical protein